MTGNNRMPNPFSRPPDSRPQAPQPGLNMHRPGTGAPPVYTPRPLISQAKLAPSAPPVYRPQSQASQPMSSIANRPGAPPVYRPQPTLPPAMRQTDQNRPRTMSPYPASPNPAHGPGLALQPKSQIGSPARVMPRAGAISTPPRPLAIQRFQAMPNPRVGNVVQRTRRRVQNPAFSEWWWNDTLAATWQGHDIPVHACHTTHVGQDQLVGGWTVIDDQGVFRQSGVYGPYEPGVGKDNHVERQLINALENALEAAMGNDNIFSDVVLAVIEVHQWVTPCSGGHGCTTFLNDQVAAFNGIYAEVSAGARLSAEFKYNAGLPETHPSHPKQSPAHVTTFADDAPVAYAPQTFVHNFPGQWW